MAHFVEEAFFEADDDTHVLAHDSAHKWAMLEPYRRVLIGTAISQLMHADYHKPLHSKIKALPWGFKRYLLPLLHADNIMSNSFVDGNMGWMGGANDEYSMKRILNALHYIGFTPQIEAIFRAQGALEFFTLRVPGSGWESNPDGVDLVFTVGNFKDATK